MPVGISAAVMVEGRHRHRDEQKMKSAMSNLSGSGCSHEQWARFRFSIIGPLLAAPPERGELQEQLKSLAAKKWHHPISGNDGHGIARLERIFTVGDLTLVGNLAFLSAGSPGVVRSESEQVRKISPRY